MNPICTFTAGHQMLANRWCALNATKLQLFVAGCQKYYVSNVTPHMEQNKNYPLSLIPPPLTVILFSLIPIIVFASHRCCLYILIRFVNRVPVPIVITQVKKKHNNRIMKNLKKIFLLQSKDFILYYRGNYNKSDKIMFWA